MWNAVSSFVKTAVEDYLFLGTKRKRSKRDLEDHDSGEHRAKRVRRNSSPETERELMNGVSDRREIIPSRAASGISSRVANIVSDDDSDLEILDKDTKPTVTTKRRENVNEEGGGGSHASLSTAANRRRLTQNTSRFKTFSSIADKPQRALHSVPFGGRRQFDASSITTVQNNLNGSRIRHAPTEVKTNLECVNSLLDTPASSRSSSHASGWGMEMSVNLFSLPPAAPSGNRFRCKASTGTSLSRSRPASGSSNPGLRLTRDYALGFNSETRRILRDLDRARGVPNSGNSSIGCIPSRRSMDVTGLNGEHGIARTTSLTPGVPIEAQSMPRLATLGTRHLQRPLKNYSLERPSQNGQRIQAASTIPSSWTAHSGPVFRFAKPLPLVADNCEDNASFAAPVFLFGNSSTAPAPLHVGPSGIFTFTGSGASTAIHKSVASNLPTNGRSPADREFR